jgi:hypothetical protein
MGAIMTIQIVEQQIERISLAEKAVTAARASLHQAIKDTFPPGTIVKAKDVHGWHRFTVNAVDGESLLVSRSGCKPTKRKYSSVELI